ncbi:hypothetical protein ACTZWW_04135 [Salinarimonas sp. NSM]|uniref:hypothetical protein n=1 Tax=Salinarimonas sp. NSM TaxID=3458003 RepID=UPI004035380E
MAFDLAKLDDLTASHDEGVWVDLKDLGAGEPLGVSVKIAGPDSKVCQKAAATLADRRIAMQNEGLTLTAEHGIALSIGFLADITLDIRHLPDRAEAGDPAAWVPGVISGGKVVPFSRELARSLYTNRMIREQVDKVAASRAPFARRSA